MDDLHAALIGGDPIAHEPGLPADDAKAIRRAVIAAAETIESRGAWWPQPLFLAATVAATILIGITLGARLPRADTRPASTQTRSALASSAAETDERRQLQFATPGGTRIIWVFDPEFNP